MLGVSGLINASADGAASSAEAPESGGAASAGGGDSRDVGAVPGGFGDDDKARLAEEGERNSGGNRWPRQETLALLKIRSDMDVVFRDSSLKGPLWEEVSRKMAELGYHRNAKKCKEKFENVYKYHKRTREGRASKADGKTYRFFDQLEAFEHINPSQPHSLPPPPRPPPPLPMPITTVPPPLPGNNNNNGNNNSSANNVINAQQVTVPSTQSPFGAAVQGVHNPVNAPTFPPSSQARSVPVPVPPPTTTVGGGNTGLFPSHRGNVNVPGSPLSDSTSSSTSSDEDIQRRQRKKRKWKDFFERLMKDVMEKQEELQKKFLEALEKRERDRMVREEAWRVQEMARMNREHDLLVQERSMAAAKDAAVLQFLQKVSDQHNLQIPITNAAPPPPPQIQITETLSTPTPQPPPPPRQLQPPPQPQPQHQQPPPQGPEPISVAPPATMPFTISTPSPLNIEVPKPDNNVINATESSSFTPASSSRWPKTEVQALIRLRTNLDMKYQESGPKGPLWEEISAGMRKLGYNRNAKRCKEKWENINKYFKKVKESNKKRPEDSKTCPYFHLLDAIYKEKAKNETSFNPAAAGSSLKPDSNPNPMIPIMVQPEQQWPLPPDQHLDHDSDNMDDDGEDDDDDEDEGGGYEIVTNKQHQSTTSTTATSTV